MNPPDKSDDTDTTFVIQISTSFGWLDKGGFRYSKHTDAFDVFQRIKQRGVAQFDSHAKAVRLVRREETVIAETEEGIAND